MLGPLGVVVPSGGGLAGREVNVLLDLLSLRLEVIAGPNWRVPAGAWFWVQGLLERIGLWQKIWGVSS